MERLKRGLVLFLASIGSIRKKSLKKGERLKRGLVVFLASIGSVPKRLGGSVRLDGESECHVDATLINKKSMIILPINSEYSIILQYQPRVRRETKDGHYLPIILWSKVIRLLLPPATGEIFVIVGSNHGSFDNVEPSRVTKRTY